ncbi:ABC transporter permease subunit [Ktedonosporobacter rubrisoli]|uniref:ABC transporter permease subunit n=2 Tax=Ktedonosporobacter rubrisoli TaxID=2509675 RepID=A0A4P6JQQ8_KTERU|nr:ABC transporter permease subunit [Ktedonosporobacter rubrisoli]
MMPSTTSSVLIGLHIAIPYALIGDVMAELIDSNSGIGYLINTSATQFDSAGVLAALLVLTAIADVLNVVVSFLDRMTSRWKSEVNLSRKTLP